MIQIRHPKPDQQGDVEELWRFAFGDGPQFQREFYRLCAPDGPLALWEDGELRSMLALPEVGLRFGRTTARAGYVYAVATALGHAGKGWATTLLTCAAGLARDRGLDCLVTVPASPNLFRFYEKNGFRPGFFLRELTSEPKPAPAVPLAPSEYNALREDLLSERTHISYPDGQLAFQQALCPSPGSGLYRLELPHGPGCAAVENWPNAPIVKELLCAPGDVEAGAAACSALCGRPVRARVPAGAADGTPFAMIRWFPGTPQSVQNRAGEGWLGLAFD